jgi:opacity protein-like surface antigen
MNTSHRRAKPALPRLLAGAILLAAAASAASASDSICPDTINVKQAGVAPAAEWSLSYSATPTELESVTFYNGPPKDEASLVYDTWNNAKDTSTATWKFPKDARGYWIKCSYRGTTAELAKALPPVVSICRVSYERQAASGAGLPVIKRIACQ